MNVAERIKAFHQLGKQLTEMPEAERQTLAQKAIRNNPWFTQENIHLALKGIGLFLEEDKLTKWVNQYKLNPETSKTIGVAMAGNIPLVGFHDYLCILIAGHKAQIKLSTQDDILLPYVHSLLVAIEPLFSKFIAFEEKLHDYNAAIATGSDNTGRYFSYYFKHVPHIIRKNRSSCAILIGGETDEALDELGKDVFTYFGLGCRNVSKLYIPEEYDLVPLLRNWEKFSELTHHNKFANNYNYQRSINLINQKHFYDNGAILLIESDQLVSPIAVVYYERYKDQEDLKNRLIHHVDKLQCILSAKGWFKGSIDFGKAQSPEVWDYADNVDTLKFLAGLN